MIADLTQYSEYKDSGLPWLGRVPGHWGLVPNRGLVRRRKVLVGKQHGDYRLLSLTKQGIVVRDISTGRGKFSSDMGTSQEVRSGDLVFCLFDVPETPRTVGLSRHDGMITGAYTVFESLGRGSAEYFELFYRAMDDRKLLSPLYSGLRNTIPAERFLGTKTPQPPPTEQEAIVRFLDWANGRLERAIRAKRKVIALLNEQKQAIIHRAVTRGLDPSVPLKPSGTPWLGDIPQHWEVKQLRRLVRYGTTITYGIVQAGPDVEGGIPYIRTSDMKGQVLPRSGYLRTSSEIDSAYRRSKVEPGDLVIAIRATLGKGLLVPDYLAGANLTQGTARVAPSEALASQFLFYAFNSSYCQESIRLIAKGTTFLEITLEALRQIPLAIPPLTEQRRLSAAISEQIQPLIALVARTEREITLLLEYRTRLVADVVTGKLDVREAAARLPDEAQPETVGDDADLSDETVAADEEAAV